MAEAKKRKPSSGGARKAAGGGRQSAGRRAAPRGKTTRAAAPRPVRREVGAAVCLLLAIFSFFCYFQLDALFLGLFGDLLKGLFGYGFWFVCPALLAAAGILAFHHGRPVRLRVWCALLLPVLMGVLLHLFLVKGDYAAAGKLIPSLWADGCGLKCGGVVSGLIAIGCIKGFSRVASSVILILLGLIMVMAVLRITPGSILAFFRTRPEYEPEEDEPEAQEPAPHPAAEPARVRDRRSIRNKPQIDIPVDDGPLAGEKEEQPRKERLFDRNARVRRPDEFLRGVTGEGQPVPEEPKTETLPELHPEPTPIKAEAPVMPEPSVVEEPAPPADIRQVDMTRSVPVTREPAVPRPAETKAEKRPEEAGAEEQEEAVAQQVATELDSAMAQPEAHYDYPPVRLLKEMGPASAGDVTRELKVNEERLADTIQSFGIDAHIVNVTRGPSVTRYELELDRGVKLNKLTNLADDIALSLGASSVRIAPIPDKISVVGIEVPNKTVTAVPIRDVIDSKEFQEHPSKVCFALGKDISGRNIVGNIAKLPHMLIAGTTGSGKSVCTNSLIISLLYKATPDEVRLIMVDPKMVELGIYNGIPHLLIPVVTDPKKAAGALQWAVTEMMKRYRLFSEAGVRELNAYNKWAAQQPEGKKLPQIVVVIDELADLMLVAAKEVEESICRVAQMGRAAGMHLIIATQRPSADVITGLMKANIPSRIAFAVASSLESRIILDITGAEKLVGRGDMLYFPLGSGKPQRVQGCLISDEEVAAVVDFVKKSGTADYDESIMKEVEENAQAKDKKGKGPADGADVSADEEGDELLPAAVDVFLETGQASVSMLQRRLKLGYSRAARLVDQMEERGLVGPFEGSKPRQLLVTKEQWAQMQGGSSGDEFAQIQQEFEDEPPFDTDTPEGEA